MGIEGGLIRTHGSQSGDQGRHCQIPQATASVVQGGHPTGMDIRVSVFCAPSIVGGEMIGEKAIERFVL